MDSPRITRRRDAARATALAVRSAETAHRELLAVADRAPTYANLEALQKAARTADRARRVHGRDARALHRALRAANPTVDEAVLSDLVLELTA